MKLLKVLVIILIIGVVLGGIGYLALGKDGIGKLSAPVERIEATIVEEQVVTSVALTVSADDIVFHESTDNKLKIEYYDYKDTPFTYSFVDGTATLSEPQLDTNNWIDMLRIQRQTVDYTVNVYLPASCTGTIAVHLASGEVTLENWTCDRFEFEVSSGEIKAENLTANGITGQITSGDFSLSYSTVNNVAVTATSGDITLSHITAEDITAITTSGSIDIASTTAVDVTTNTSSGGTRCDRLRADSVKANSSSGQHSFVLIGTPEEYRIDADVSSGEIFIYNGTEKLVQTEDDIIYGSGSRTIDVSASSGGIRIGFVAE